MPSQLLPNRPSIDERRAAQRKLKRQALKRMNLLHDAYKTRKKTIITARHGEYP